MNNVAQFLIMGRAAKRPGASVRHGFRDLRSLGGGMGQLCGARDQREQREQGEQGEQGSAGQRTGSCTNAEQAACPASLV